MDSVEQIVEKTAVKFPRVLSLEEAESLVRYIAEELPANINYRASYFMSLYHMVKIREEPKRVRLEPERGTVSITGNIRSLKDFLAFDTFESVNSDTNSEKLSAFRFTLVPGWDMGDYRPNVVQLWNDVRRVVGDYFSRNPASPGKLAGK